MTAGTFLKSTAPATADYSGIAKMLALRSSGPGAIFTLHSPVANSAPYLGDIRCPVAAFANVLQREVGHFAYPFGNARACGKREAQIARAVGFRTAVTTRRGTLFPDHPDDLYALPREPLAANDTPATMRCKLGGVNRAFQSLFGNPVARM